jgi:hypothetical protein
MNVNVNPYESPRPGDVFTKEAMNESESIRQLLVEIRNAQLESLQLQREALERSQKMLRFRYPLAILPFLIILPTLFFTRYYLRTPPSVPPRPVPRVAPPVSTPVNPPVTFGPG